MKTLFGCRWRHLPVCSQDLFVSWRRGSEWEGEQILWWCLLAFLVAWTVKRQPTMWETGVRSLCREGPLEKDMATHSSIHAWKIPWTEEPDGLQSMGWQSRTRLSDFSSLHFTSLKWKWSHWVLSVATPWTVAYLSPPSMGFSRQEYWSGLPFPSPEKGPNPSLGPILMTSSNPNNFLEAPSPNTVTLGGYCLSVWVLGNTTFSPDD